MVWNNTKYVTSGTYIFSTINSKGCDSIATLILTINQSTNSTDNITICAGQLPYTWNSLTFNTAGTQTAHLTNNVGCDSAATLILTTTNNPTVKIEGGKAICGTTATTKLTATVSPNNGGIAYNWKSLAFNDNNWSIAGIDSTLDVSVMLPTQYQLTITIAGCGTFVSNQQGVTPIAPPNLTFAPSPITSICNNNIINFVATSTDIDSNNYAFYRGTTLLQNDTLKTYTTPILTTANNGDIYSIEAINNLPKFDGKIDENFWGTQLASSMGGAAPSFGAGHELNALYVRADSANVYFAIAGNVKNQNRIMLFIDSKTGGYNNGNYGRGGLGNNAIRNFNSGSTFDEGFFADYVLGIGTDATTSQYYIDLFTMSGTAGVGGGPNNYIGSNLSPANGYKIGASPVNQSQTRGFEIAIPKTAINYTGGDIQVMAMYSADNGFLSNQFLTRANLGAGNYSNAAITFGAAPPNPISIPLESMMQTCKTRISTTVTVLPNLTSNLTINSCDSFTWNSIKYTTSGVYTFTSLGSNGCDSTATLNLTINYPTSSLNNVVACDSILWNGNIYKTSGTYTFNTLNINGCDSLATLNLTVNNSSTSSTTQTVCDSLTWNNVKYTTSGIYTFSTINSVGCDSTATLNLTVNNSSTSSTTQTVCDSLTWNNVKYTASGVYTFSTLNSVGCDSTATLNLTVNNSSISLTTQTVCDSLTWNNVKYTASGVYTFSTINSLGCDSTATLNLTVNKSSTSSTTQIVCDSLTWNNVKYTASGIYTFSTINSLGCDSTATLNLTVNNSSKSLVTQSVCDSLTWNGTTYFTSGVYTFSTINTTGCDSTATLNLTVNITPTAPQILNIITLVNAPQTGVVNSCYSVANAVSYLWTYTGSGATIFNNGDTLITVDYDAAATSGNFNVQAIGVGGCNSAISGAVITVVLPVKIANYEVKVSRNATNNKQQVINIWTTALEINSKLFEVQRSTDSKTFETIGTVVAKGFASNYSFTDFVVALNLPTQIYYRLKAIDNDGKFAYSQIRQVTINDKKELSRIAIYPNPASDIIAIETANARVIKIFNSLGKLVYKSTEIRELSTVPITSFSAGVYYVEVITKEGKKLVEKFIKK